MKIVLKNTNLVFQTLVEREFSVNIAKGKIVEVPISLEAGITYSLSVDVTADQNVNVLKSSSEEAANLIASIEIGDSSVTFTPTETYTSVWVRNWSTDTISVIKVKP